MSKLLGSNELWNSPGCAYGVCGRDNAMRFGHVLGYVEGVPESTDASKEMGQARSTFQ